MKKILIIAAALSAMVANASVSVNYRQDKMVDVEGVEVTGQMNVDKVAVGVNALGNEDRLVSFGAFMGVPVKTKITTLTPYLGVEGYRVNDNPIAVNVGFKTHTPVVKGFGLATDVKWSQATGRHNDLNDVSYSLGIFKKF